MIDCNSEMQVIMENAYLINVIIHEKIEPISCIPLRYTSTIHYLWACHREHTLLIESRPTKTQLKAIFNTPEASLGFASRKQ